MQHLKSSKIHVILGVMSQVTCIFELSLQLVALHYSQARSMTVAVLLALHALELSLDNPNLGLSSMFNWVLHAFAPCSHAPEANSGLGS